MSQNNRMKSYFQENTETYHHVAEIFKSRVEQSEIAGDDEEPQIEALSFQQLYASSEQVLEKQRFSENNNNNNHIPKIPIAILNSNQSLSNQLVDMHSIGDKQSMIQDDYLIRGISPVSQLQWQHNVPKNFPEYEMSQSCDFTNSNVNSIPNRIPYNPKQRRSSQNLSHTSQVDLKSTTTIHNNNNQQQYPSNEDPLQSEQIQLTQQFGTINQIRNPPLESLKRTNSQQLQSLSPQTLANTAWNKIIQGGNSADSINKEEQQQQQILLPSKTNSQSHTPNQNGSSTTPIAVKAIPAVDVVVVAQNPMRISVNNNQQKQKKKAVNFFGVILKMKNYAYRIASKVESKRILILERQKFEFLRDKGSSVFPSKLQFTSIREFNYCQNAVYMLAQQLSKLKCVRSIQLVAPSIPLFQPQSVWKFIWDILHAVVMITFFFYLPLNIIYGIGVKEIFQLEYIDVIMCILATVDIFVKLNTAIFKKGNLLQQRSQIFIEYFSKGGFINFISVLMMWTVIFESFKQNEVQMNGTIGSVFIAILVWKISTLKSIQDQINDRFYFNKIQRGLLQLTSILFNLFIVSHLFACSWLVIGKYGQGDPKNPITNCAPIQLTSSGDCLSSWLDKFQGGDSPKLAFYEEYLRAYYFMTVTMVTVGYGDITPVNSNEYLLSILTMVIACGMFGYGVNSIGRILGEMYADYKAYDEHFNAINGYMNQKNIPLDLQFQVREYLQYFFLKSNVEDLHVQQKVIKILPEYLSTSLMFQANKIVLTISPIFNEEIISKTIGIIEQKKYRPGELILEQDQEDDLSICFIEIGAVEIFNKHSSEQLRLLGPGSCFGEVSFFSGMTRRLSVKATDFTTLLTIKRSTFINLIRNSPIDYERFSMIKDQINLNSKYEGIGVSCLCCKSTSHLISECDFVHLSCDHQKIIKESCKQSEQFREQHDRRFERYNSLDNLGPIQETSVLFMEENIEWLQNEGWFNEILNKEMNHLLIRQNSTTHFSKLKTNQQMNSFIVDQPILLSDIKKSIVTPLISNKGPNFNKMLGANPDQEIKKVQFSLHSMPIIDNDETFEGSRIQLNQIAYQQIELHSQSPSRRRELSNITLDRPTSLSAAINNPTLNINLNAHNNQNPNQNSNNPNSNPNPIQNAGNPVNTNGNSNGPSSSISIQYPSKQVFSSQNSYPNMTGGNVSHSLIPSGIQPPQINYFKGYMKQFTGQSFVDQVQSNYPINSEQMAIPMTHSMLPIQRANKRKISIKTEVGRGIRQKSTSVNMRGPIASALNNVSSVVQSGGILNDKPQQEQLMRQLIEYISVPQSNRAAGISEQFENSKEFQVYLPQNNLSKVLFSFELYRRKKAGYPQSRNKKKSTRDTKAAVKQTKIFSPRLASKTATPKQRMPLSPYASAIESNRVFVYDNPIEI